MIFYHIYFTIRRWLQDGISPSVWWIHYDIKMAWCDLSHSSGTYGPCKRWGKHCSSFIQQQEDTDPTKWGPKLVYTISSFSIIVLSLQYSSRYTPWMQLQNLKDSLSINNSLLFITYFWPTGLYLTGPFCEWNRTVAGGFPPQRQITIYKEFWCFSSVSWNNGLKKTRQI